MHLIAGYSQTFCRTKPARATANTTSTKVVHIDRVLAIHLRSIA